MEEDVKNLKEEVDIIHKEIGILVRQQELTNETIKNIMESLTMLSVLVKSK